MKRHCLLWAVLPVALSLFAYAQSSADEAIRLADQSFREGRYHLAFQQYEKANKAAGGKCSPCLVKMSHIKVLTGDEADARKFAVKALESAKTEHERAEAYAVKGDTLLSFAGDNKKKLAEAEQCFRDGLKEDPKAAIYHLRMGSAMARQEKYEESKAEFRAFLELVPNFAEAALVRRWIDDPRKCKWIAAPEFSFTDQNGRQLSLAQFAGKVVLLDFWGTWCPPCRASVPELKDLVKKYPESSLVLISVSSDEDEKKWAAFIAAQNMTWPQFLDSDRKVQSKYFINSFPTYIVIDSEGFIRERISGLDPQMSLIGRIEGSLKKLIAQ